MKKLFLLIGALMTLGIVPAFSQPGMGGGPNFGGAMDKLFGANQSFTAVMNFQASGADGNNITTPGKMSFDAGKSRFEVNMSEMKGTKISPDAAQQIKAMGMDTIISISRPDLKLGYLVYPGLNSYVAKASKDPSAAANPDDYKVETSAIGKETVDGHDCAKNKVVVTDKDGNKHEYTVWNASDLKDFPIEIVTSDDGRTATILFKNVSFAKPDASLFEVPSGYTKYDNAQTMVQTEMMKKMGSGGAPPAQQ